jgi:LPXTG-motif cell wall-anchored protein
MLGWRRSISVAAALLALLPAGAAAQSAGDEQYQDPFADDPGQEAPAAPPAATPAPATPAAPAPTAAAPATATAPATTGGAPQASAAQLPRTGGEAWLLALAGLALMSAGVALRVHARRPA